MSSRADRTDGEVDWPPQFERTPRRECVSTTKFSVTFSQATDEIETELMTRLEADSWRVSTAAPHRKGDGLPYAGAHPNDPAVVIRWTKGGNQYAVACDYYDDWRDNARAIGLYVKEKRKMSNRPVTTGQSEFATARLPSGDGDEISAADPPPHQVLDIIPDAPEGVVKAAAREKMKKAHPDQGGSAEALQRVRRAKEQMLDGDV